MFLSSVVTETETYAIKPRAERPSASLARLRPFGAARGDTAGDDAVEA